MDAPGATDTNQPTAESPAAPTAPLPQDLAGVIGYADSLAADGRLHEAVEIYRNVLRQHPRILGVHFNLGVALLRHERGAEAVAHFDTLLRAANCPPQLIPRTRQALALALEQSGDAAAAAAEYRRLLALEPANFAVQRQLATLYRDLGVPERAIEAFERCLQLWPAHCGVALDLVRLRLDVFDWTALPDAAAQHALARACLQPPEGVEPPPPHALLDLPAGIDEALIGAVAKAHARFIEHSLGPLPPGVPPAPRDGRRLRLAYATHDVQSAQSGWIRALLRHHDRSRYELVLYTWGPNDGSPERELSLLDAEHAVDVAGMSDAAIARRLQRDGIDVLIDPGSAARTTRPGLFARRATPLQLAWLGDPLAAWSGWYHGLLCDAAQLALGEAQLHHGDPPALLDAPFASPLVLLHGCARAPLVDDTASASPIRATHRAALGLPPKAPVLALLAEPGAIDRNFFEMSLRVASLVAGAAVWLRDPGPAGRRRLQVHLLDWRKRHPSGALPTLAFLPGSPGDRVQSRLRQADLVLDTGREVGAPLVLDALAVGLPVLTLRHAHHTRAVAASLLFAAGEADAVCANLDTLEARARGLMQQPRQLISWRRRLIDGAIRRSITASTAASDESGPPLWRPDRTAQAIEAAVEQLWHRHIGDSH